MRNTSQQPGTAQKIAIKQRIPKAIELRLQGYEYQQIADELGVSILTAWNDVMRGLDQLNDNMSARARILREITLGRLEEAIRLVMDDMTEAIAGENGNGRKKVNYKAISALCKLIDRVARIEGLEAPKELDVKVQISDMTTEERISRVNELMQAAHQKQLEGPKSEWLVLEPEEVKEVATVG